MEDGGSETLRRRRAGAFTLIELMAVTVLLVGAVGWATLSMQGLGDNGKIEAAAEQIVSAYRLAALQARGAGLPAALHCDATSCTVRKPRCVEDEWQLVDGAKFALHGDVELQSVTGPLAAEQAPTSASWMIAVPTQGAWWAWKFKLCVSIRLCAELEIDAFTGEHILSFLDVAAGK